MKILFFGILAEDVGATELEMEHVENLDALQELLFNKFPVLKSRRYIMSLNKEMAEGDTTLNPGDEIALLPPFAGG
jgi:molybdopterin synthase sulfur carrier subunit